MPVPELGFWASQEPPSPVPRRGFWSSLEKPRVQFLNGGFLSATFTGSIPKMFRCVAPPFLLPPAAALLLVAALHVPVGEAGGGGWMGASWMGHVALPNFQAYTTLPG